MPSNQNCNKSSNLQNSVLLRLFRHLAHREGHLWPIAGEHPDRSEPTNDMPGQGFVIATARQSRSRKQSQICKTLQVSQRISLIKSLCGAGFARKALLVIAFACCAMLLSASEPATSSKLLLPGQPAPVSTLNATDDVAHQFPVAGQWNMVFFWSLFCHSCLEEMPVVQAKLSEIGESGLKAFFVSLDTARMQKALINFCKLRDLKQPVLMERVASDSFEIADKWGVVMTPSVFIVDPDGNVVWSHQGPLDIEKFFADFREMSQPQQQSPASAACSCEGH